MLHIDGSLLYSFLNLFLLINLINLLASHCNRQSFPLFPHFFLKISNFLLPWLQCQVVLFQDGSVLAFFKKKCLLRCLTPHAWENWIYENMHSDSCLVYGESHWTIFWENFPRWNFDPDLKMSDFLNCHVFGGHLQ